MTPLDRDSAPKRRLRLNLDLGADDLDSLASALRSIAHDLEYEGQETVDRTSGGYSDGFHLTLTCDPDMTGEVFRDRLESWRQARVAERDRQVRCTCPVGNDAIHPEAARDGS